jgi:alpha-beta hydrolase superfamily lysophospholipase
MARPLDHVTPRLTRLGPPPGQARGEALFLHGAWVGGWHLAPLAEAAAEAGFGASLLDLPGHGDEVWELPSSTGLKDYALVAARAAGGLGRPALVGHSMGGWLAQKLLEAADLPALLLCPLPGDGLPLANALRLTALDPWGMAAALAGRPLRVRDARVLHRVCFRGLSLAEAGQMLDRMGPEPARAALDMGLGLARARPAPGRRPRVVAAAEHDFFVPQIGRAHV